MKRVAIGQIFVQDEMSGDEGSLFPGPVTVMVIPVGRGGALDTIAPPEAGRKRKRW